uniref:Uncharacterized protein n=1 Tax=Molossus molossus TaxID=27622 RepID=A0A7J8FYM5_MOLMO|nr:hypothetical protein HJG59_008217 [Molossus molossus]
MQNHIFTECYLSSRLAGKVLCGEEPHFETACVDTRPHILTSSGSWINHCVSHGLSVSCLHNGDYSSMYSLGMSMIICGIIPIKFEKCCQMYVVPRPPPPHYHKLCSRVSHIWGSRRGQHILSAMDKPRPGKTTFVIMVSPLPGEETTHTQTEVSAPTASTLQGQCVGAADTDTLRKGE